MRCLNCEAKVGLIPVLGLLHYHNINQYLCCLFLGKPSPIFSKKRFFLLHPVEGHRVKKQNGFLIDEVHRPVGRHLSCTSDDCEILLLNYI